LRPLPYLRGTPPASARFGLLLRIAKAPRKDLAGHCERIGIAKRHM
jgi:hypothetical protein